jgi:hypothetical protein
MKRRIYVETSVISYLTARPSKTIIGAAHQQITLAWWELRSDYELLVSQSVWLESFHYTHLFSELPYL